MDYVNYYQLADLIITGRGGGSTEDLWAFNEEVVARAVFQSHIPVISAVGHEPDVSICDFVADVRAATPSNGAELAVPDQSEMMQSIAHLARRMERSALRPLNSARERLDRLKHSRALTDPGNYIRDRRVMLDYQSDRMIHGLERVLAKKQQQFSRLGAALDAMSPLKVLGRGYSITYSETGGVIASANQVEEGDPVSIRLKEGVLQCRVEERKCP